jgi:hypothetical protein
MRAALLLMNVSLSVTDGDARGAARVGSRGGAGVPEGTR